jgi:hypothetical protein
MRVITCRMRLLLKKALFLYCIRLPDYDMSAGDMLLMALFRN